jgi:hypothetical protein
MGKGAEEVALGTSSEEQATPIQPANPSTAVQVIMPAAVTVNNDPGPYNQELQKKVQREQQLVSGAMFIDKVAKEKVKKEQTPIYEKACKQMELLQKKLTAKAKKMVSALKNDQSFQAVKDALSEIGIEVKCSLEFVSVDMQERTSNAVLYKRVVEKISDAERYSDEWKSEDIELDFTDEMKELQTKFWEQYDIASEAKAKIVAAEAMLKDRANRMADIQGLVALKNMSDDDKALAAEIQSHCEDKDITKLLSSGKKKA